MTIGCEMTENRLGRVFSGMEEAGGRNTVVGRGVLWTL